MQSRLQERFAVQTAPQTDGAELVTRRERLVREVLREFFRGHVHVGENDDASDGMLDDLGTPTGVESRIEPLATDEAESFQERDQWREARAARTIRVVIVIGPAEAESVLPSLLYSSRLVATEPVVALGGEEQLARAISPQVGDRGVHELRGVSEPGGIVIEDSRA